MAAPEFRKVGVVNGGTYVRIPPGLLVAGTYVAVSLDAHGRVVLTPVPPAPVHGGEAGLA